MSAPAAEEGFDATLRASIFAVGATGLSFAVFALLGFGQRPALGVLAGGAIATANLWLLARIVSAFFARQRSAALWSLVAIIKLLALVGGVWLLVKEREGGPGLLHGLHLAIGWTALPVGITLGAVFGPKPPGDEEPGEAGGAPPGA